MNAASCYFIYNIYFEIDFIFIFSFFILVEVIL